jgi:geranylgeranyl pyrophosphate synthase
MTDGGDTARLRTGMAAPAPLEALLAVGGVELSRLLHRTESRLAEIAETHGPELGGHVTHTLSAGGKRLRPMLVFLCGGDGEGDPLVRAAVATELLHMATLVHDDVLDGASLRRGRPTVVAAAGRGAATATGDLLFSRAFAELTRNGRPDEVRELSGASSALALGELLQRADAWDGGIGVERYLERCELKTARLFAAACRLGALQGDGGEARVQALGEFGHHVGLAFQLLDDVLDVSGPPERTGKARGTDLLDGTVTLPFILARERDPDLAALEPRSVRDPAEAERVCDQIQQTGALHQARARALEIVSRAKAGLPRLPDSQAAALTLVADGVVDRYA